MAAEGHTESEIVEQLVGAAAQGDRDAQDALLRRYWAHIGAIVRGRMFRLSRGLRGREEDRDLVQDAVMRILRELPRHALQGRRPFLAWMRRVADAAVIDRQRFHAARRRSPEAEMPLDSRVAHSARSPDSRIDREREAAGLLSALRQLEPDTAAAVLMHHMGYTHAEVAAHLELGPEQVRKRIARAEVKLAELVADER